jgi:hypothetical protein
MALFSPLVVEHDKGGTSIRRAIIADRISRHPGKIGMFLNISFIKNQLWIETLADPAV